MGDLNGSSDTSPEAAYGLDYDVLIIGAGLSGIYTLISMKKLGLRARVIERGSGPGGVWFWNRYPGARLDSESYTYMFTFSQEVLDEWDWKEHFSAQEDTLRYINFVIDKHNIRPDIQLNTEVKSARYDEVNRSWTLADQNGNYLSSRFLINCLGPLSSPTLPNIPGVADFRGEAYHTSRWPQDHLVSFEGKRVGIIGTGATGIQIIQEVAKTAGQLTVFQRTANWTAPLRNSTISPDEMNAIRADYPEIIRKCKSTPMGFMYEPDPRNALDIPEKEREELWETHYNMRGLIKWVANFKDIFTNQEANDLYSNWMANKIRARVNDPVIAEKLIPKTHGFGTRRVPLETGYYELFNRANVKLVDLNDTPIKRITATGVETTVDHIELDILIYATGFDALTGSYEEIDYYGEGGVALKDLWKDGPLTYLGFMSPNFPNMFNILGPHQGTGNIPHAIEYAVRYVARFVEYLTEANMTYVVPDQKGVEQWTEHVFDCTKGLLSANVNSWMTGYNSNKKGKAQRRVVRYFGGLVRFRERCEDVAADNYRHFVMK
ncbi:2-oxo-Delta(3)-4,5,5-trimethylcyclopentenylacetyl-CoA monooxygenase [Aspergillus lentulus]|nr:2-oxo-Delta(3)-4,5,5-trimethylcyclopentenylacetyl-CoA monooxygenase [Aspergillus lentulus]